MIREIKGIHVLLAFILAFGTIIAVNVVLAVNAVRTFPGLEVKNSYVASQSFEVDRAAQTALNWTVTANVQDDQLTLVILENGKAINPVIDKAIFGRATSVSDDQYPEFTFADGAFSAPVSAGPGNWNLRLKAHSDTGVPFTRRIVVKVDQ